MPAPYIGTVEDVKDPLGLGRIRVRASEVHGESSSPQWAWPTNGIMAGSGRGFFFVPRVGDPVRIDFHQGNTSRPIWSSGPWSNDSGPGALPSEFAGQANQEPLRQGFATDRWVVVMDDSSPGEFKIIDRTTGAEIEMKNDGSIVIDPKVTSGLIDLIAGATEFLMKGTAFLGLHNANVGIYNVHTHLDPVSGSTGVPSSFQTLMVAGTHTSTRVKTG